MDERGVTFRWKDYRAKGQATRHKTMTLAPEEFMRRFLLHVLPGGFHRIRHYGLLANGSRKESLAMVRDLLMPSAQGTAPARPTTLATSRQRHLAEGARLRVPPLRPAIDDPADLARGQAIRAPPPCAGGP